MPDSPFTVGQTLTAGNRKFEVRSVVGRSLVLLDLQTKATKNAQLEENHGNGSFDLIIDEPPEDYENLPAPAPPPPGPEPSEPTGPSRFDRFDEDF
jgi:hypothetical protein